MNPKKIQKIEDGKVEVIETSENRSVYDIAELKEQRRIHLEKLAIIEEVLGAIKELY